MASVTQRITEVKQPRGGYIKPSNMQVVTFNDNINLWDNETVHASNIGLVVDYLTRYMLGMNIVDAFKISLIGAKCAEQCGKINSTNIAMKLLHNIKGLDYDSICNACKLVTFDVWYRNRANAILAKTYTDIVVDNTTAQNIKTMIKRSINFFKTYGPIVEDGFTFDGGYTSTVTSGDGDFLTSDTLWDFKVSKNKPTSKHTLQLLMYYIMGKHSKKEIFNNISKIGIFNPRLNIVYIYDMKNISREIIEDVERNIICY